MEDLIQAGRTTTGVERVDDTVRRPSGEHSAFVRTLLQHLEGQGFLGAPRWLGSDASGRDVLTYLPGEVPPQLGNLSTDQIMAGARLLRTLHDASLGFEGLGSSQVVCHGDASPCNCVFRDRLPYAFIDFDAAHIGDRREDIGYASWLWLDIGNDELEPFAQGRRLGEFVAAYDADCRDAVPALIASQIELSSRRGAPRLTQEWAHQCWHWSNEHRAALEAGLACSRQAAF